MTAVRLIALWCDFPETCSEEFIGEQNTRIARRQAAEKGWRYRVNMQGQGKDFCPRHAAGQDAARVAAPRANQERHDKSRVLVRLP